jgi:hypothetical protein
MFHDSKQKQRIRPFSITAGVNCRSYSMPLQRAIADFGADHPFNEINKKLKEHYGIEAPIDSARKITEQHAQEIAKLEGKAREESPCVPKGSIIGEADGSMVPIVEYKEPPDTVNNKWDKRKHKVHHYCEARLSLAHEKGSLTPKFAGTFGTVQLAGEQLMSCVQRVGFDHTTKVHCVGDGAVWIANQVEERFGANGTYLIDFYHLCEYLSAASTVCGKGRENDWMEQQKALLKDSQSNEVLLNLMPFLEPRTVPEIESPVRACHRYIKNRPNQLDYKKAIENDLPIGSGEIESAHRYVIQKRLKIAGSWWKKETAGNMLALRVLRANNKWDDYWDKKAA